jgi:hypothetical protein
MGLPQVEQFWSHDTFPEHQILLASMVTFGHYDLYSVGDEHKKAEHMLLVTRQPHRFDSALSIAMSMRNGIL